MGSNPGSAALKGDPLPLSHAGGLTIMKTVYKDYMTFFAMNHSCKHCEMSLDNKRHPSIITIMAFKLCNSIFFTISSQCSEQSPTCAQLCACLFVAKRPSNIQVYRRDRYAQTILHAATLRQKLQTKLSTSPSHSILTPGQPVPALTQ